MRRYCSRTQVQSGLDAYVMNQTPYLKAGLQDRERVQKETYANSSRSAREEVALDRQFWEDRGRFVRVMIRGEANKGEVRGRGHYGAELRQCCHVECDPGNIPAQTSVTGELRNFLNGTHRVREALVPLQRPRRPLVAIISRVVRRSSFALLFQIRKTKIIGE